MAYPITDQKSLVIAKTLGTLSFRSRCIPEEWNKHLVNEKGTVKVNAADVLAEILYWYRPVAVYHPQTQKLIGFKKKYKNSLLQKSYQEIAKKLNLSLDQVKAAVLYLEEKGFIERHFRDIQYNSIHLSNVMFIEIFLDKILEITLPKNDVKEVEEQEDEEEGEEIYYHHIEGNYCFGENPLEEKDLTEKMMKKLDSKKEFIQEIDANNKNIETVEKTFEKSDSQETNLKQVDSDLAQNLVSNAKLLHQEDDCCEKKFAITYKNTQEGVLKNTDTYTSTSSYTTSKTTSSCNKSLNSDRSLTFSKEESLFLEELLAIKPHEGKPIEKSSATWWIKFFGIDKIKTALAVYWQRVNKALKCFWFEGPRDIGGTIRQALKNNTQVYQEPVKKTAMSQTANPSKAFINNTLEPAYVSKNASQIKLQAVYEPKSNSQESLKSVEQAELKTQTDLQPLQVQKEEIKVDIEAMSQSELEAMLKAEIEAIYEPRPIAPEKQEVIAQEKVEVAPQLQSTVYKPLENLLQKQLETITKSKAESVEPVEVTANSQKPLIIQPTLEKAIQDSAQIVQKPLNANAAQKAFMYFNEDEKKCLRYLLNYIPAKGEKIPETEATWWIKEFGVAKVKTAMQVYAQQVEKASKSSAVPMPESIGGYVRNALNQGLQPCREMDLRNKSFAEEFKQKMNWAELVITEKYCSAKNIGKEWFYHVNEALFKQSLQECYTNCFSDHGCARGI
jgi:DNA-binding Lrp family transcriptional regulator